MAQFDLKVWVQDKSREVITRDGRPVRIVCWDSPNKTFPIVGFVKNEEEIFVWDCFGYCREGHIERDVDLVFADAKENLSDDSIRKGLIGHLKECRKNTRSEVMLGEYAKWIAWLEKQKEKNFNNNFPSFDEAQGTAFIRKQGEQNHTDKVEPKFNAGDWVKAISSGNIFKILSVNEGLYHVLCYDGVEANYPIEDVDYDLVYWTIQDAKDGDILMANAPFIFNGNLEGGIGCPGAHCGINTLGKFQIPKYQEHWTGHTTTPATKEQRDLLFQKMKEAGYEWDAEKKELKKIEYKHICELDNSYACVTFPFKAKVKSSGAIVTIYGGQLSLDGKEWIKYQSDAKDRYKVYEPNNLELVCEIEQKPAWSEDDETMLFHIIEHFEWFYKEFHPDVPTFEID